MDVVAEFEVLESDVRDVEQKCEKVNCSAIYDAIIASFKLLYDLIFVCTVIYLPFSFIIMVVFFISCFDCVNII